jgi:amidase
MRRPAIITILLTISMSAGQAHAFQTEEPKHLLSGSWLGTAEFYATTIYFRIQFTQDGDKLTGTFAGSKLEGTVHGNSVHLLASDANGDTSEANATLKDGVLTGTRIDTDPNDKTNPRISTFTAARIPARSTSPPQRHEFTPTVFYRQYSAEYKPVLTVAPGDTIHTTTVDAGGVDAQGVRRSRGGNPETGPFYIQTAVPGDTLVVHLLRVRLNRDYAGSDDSVVESALNSDLAVRMKDTGKSIRWRLDIAKGVATPENPSEHLVNYTVPLRPMIGCIATATGPAQAAPGTGDSGYYGGNMDFNEIVEGSTVYLPVANPGALLYLGDGHAAMGDGEINGNALETSMDVEFTVDVISGKPVHFPRVETPTHIISMGLEGSLDDAFRSATNNMAVWLADDYKLTPSEIAQVIGTAAEYKVSEVADRNSGIVLKINKERLRSLTPAATKTDAAKQ